MVACFMDSLSTRAAPAIGYAIRYKFGFPSPKDDYLSIAMFIESAKARPQHWKEPPVETEFRFLIETWPCNR